MHPAQRLAVTFSGGRPDRVPVLPKIWLNAAAQLTGTPPRQMIEDPFLAMRTVVDAALATGVDGVRVFLQPVRRTIETESRLMEVDDSGRKLGEIDLQGGWATHLEDVSDFWIDDPYRVAFHTIWRRPDPFVHNLDDVQKMAVPDKAFYESTGYGAFVRRVRTRAGENVGLCGDCDSATLAFCASFRGTEQALFDLIDAPDLVHALMEKGIAHAIARGKFFIDAGLQILRLNDSLANMSVISARQFDEFVAPHMKQVCDELHHYCPEVNIYCHICGNVLPIVERLPEIGFDCIGPLDPLGGFAVSDVRKAVGDDVVLMGGVNTLSFSQAAPDEIYAEALRCIEEGNRNGRYILGSGCALPMESRQENIEALVRASRESSHHYA